MDEPPATPPKRRMSWGCWISIIVLSLLAASLFVPMYKTTCVHGTQMKASNDCRQIIMAMKIYASDHNGQYPTGATANEAFRQLIQDELLPDERIFGSPKSPYLPDGRIGVPPDYRLALISDENHWMLVDGMNEKSPAHFGLVFENSLDTTWPPKWDVAQAGKLTRGRPWRGHKIIIGLNDNSVNVEARPQNRPPPIPVPIPTRRPLPHPPRQPQAPRHRGVSTLPRSGSFLPPTTTHIPLQAPSHPAVSNRRSLPA